MRKYIEELGVEPYILYGQNDEREEVWAKQREEFGFDDRDTWSLDLAFAKFMYERLMRFNEVNNIATESEDERRYNFHGIKITFQECIDRMIEGFKCYILADRKGPVFEKETKQKVEDAMDIFRECWQALWW